MTDEIVVSKEKPLLLESKSKHELLIIEAEVSDKYVFNSNQELESFSTMEEIINNLETITNPAEQKTKPIKNPKTMNLKNRTTHWS